MKVVFSRLLVAVMIFTLIGGTAAEAAGIQSEPSLADSHEALSRVSVFAGNGDFNDWDGAASEASFRMPQGIAVLKDGSVLVADTRNHLIRQVKNGEVSTYAGFMLDAGDDGVPVGASHDGTKETAVFNEPSGMDTDLYGNIYITDT
ncbi:copper amine oxidase, partial [Peribacillus sp. NPDC056705]